MTDERKIRYLEVWPDRNDDAAADGWMVFTHVDDDIDSVRPHPDGLHDAIPATVHTRPATQQRNGHPDMNDAYLKVTRNLAFLSADERRVVYYNQYGTLSSPAISVDEADIVDAIPATVTTRPAWALAGGDGVYVTTGREVRERGLDWFYAGKWRKHDDLTYRCMPGWIYPAREPVAREPVARPLSGWATEVVAVLARPKAVSATPEEIAAIREALDHLETR